MLHIVKPISPALCRVMLALPFNQSLQHFGFTFKDIISKLISILFCQQMAVFLSWWVQLPVTHQVCSFSFEIQVSDIQNSNSIELG